MGLAQLSDIMDFKLYPFGNAKESKKGDEYVFTCQHGPAECVGNLIFACAMHYHNTTAEWFPFVECVEGSRSNPSVAAPGCATKAGFDDYTSNIEPCSSGKEGNALMHIIAQDTINLSPAHQWTPWIVLNGKPLSEKQLDQHLTSLVCDAYTGTKPPACKREKCAK